MLIHPVKGQVLDESRFSAQMEKYTHTLGSSFQSFSAGLHQTIALSWPDEDLVGQLLESIVWLYS